jgi:hypothetical protein
MVVIPEELVADATENEVRLKISREQVDALPEFWLKSGLIVEDQKYEVDDKLFAIRRNQEVEVGRAPNPREPGMIEDQLTESVHEHLGLRVRAGQQVYCRDGHAGQVSLILLDPQGRVKGLVLRTGHLPLVGCERMVPAEWVQEVDSRRCVMRPRVQCC